MTSQALIKLGNVVWIILNETDDEFYLHRLSMTARYHKKSGKLVTRNVRNGQFKSKVIR